MSAPDPLHPMSLNAALVDARAKELSRLADRPRPDRVRRTPPWAWMRDGVGALARRVRRHRRRRRVSLGAPRERRL